MICTKCGAANRPGAKFCDECGQMLKAVASPPIPGPHPGMRYRRARKDTVTPEPPPAEPVPPKPEPVPPPRRDPPSEVPRREAVAPSPRRDPAPRERKKPLPVEEPMLSAEALHRRAAREPDVEVTTPAPKRKRSGGSDEHDNATIMIVLALVFFAILVVGASGVYFNLRESHPDLMRKEAERAESARTTHSPLPAMANFELPSSPVVTSPAVAPGITPDPPGVAPIPDDIVPQSNPAILEPLAASEPPSDEPSLSMQIAQAMAASREQPPSDMPAPSGAAPASTAASLNDAEVESMIRTPNTSSGKPARKGYKAQFRQFFGQVVIERTYPSMAMKKRAQQLWAREQKILEPDGSINDKYAPKREPSRIPGH